MKISLPLKLGIGVVVFFGLLLCGLFLWTQRIPRYIAKLNSADARERVEGVDRLIMLGERGREILAKELAGGEAAADFLIAHWAKPNKVVAQDKGGRYPLHLAAAKGYPTVAELLIANGAEVDAKAKYDWTPLHMAAEYGRKAIVEILIAKGAEVDVKSNVGLTPLHDAARKGHKAVAELLILKGAEVNAKTNFGGTPLDWAIGRGQNEVAALLREHGGERGKE